MMENLVSTIIPVKNRPQMLCESVESVLAQTYRPIEVIIVNDGSTDETAQVAEELASRHPGIIRVIHQKARGPGPAREAGRLQAQGEFIQYLDSDDLLLPDKFELQVSALRKNPDCGIAYGMTSLVNDAGDVLEPVFKWTGKCMERLFPALLVDRWWCTHTPLYRRSVIDRIGPWSSLRYSQDWEYDARAGALNTKLVYVPDPMSQHRMHGGGRQTGHGGWLAPADQVFFFKALYAGAVSAGVPLSCREMQHFARWLFFAARKAALSRAPDSASAMLELAIASAGSNARQMVWFRRLCNLTGWRTGALFADMIHRAFGGRHGSDTLKQSWMGQAI